LNIKEFTKENNGISGIYCWSCTINGRKYIGSSISIGKRISGEYTDFKKGNFCNSDLQVDWDANTEEDFDIAILETCEPDKLLVRECFWIKNTENTYNKALPVSEINLSSEDIERFFRFVDKKEISDCWCWTGSKDKDGYGRIGFKIDNKKKMFRANRLAYFIENPADDQHSIVCHNCDNPSCCNPNHLFLGTSSQNSKDCRNKGRQGSQKLNWEEVNKIREKYLEDVQIDQHELREWVLANFGHELPACYIIKVCENSKWRDDSYHPPSRVITQEIMDEIVSVFSGTNTSFSKISKYLKEKHGMGISHKKLVQFIPSNLFTNNTRKKLDWDSVNYIRELSSNGVNLVSIKKHLEANKSISVSENMIGLIVNNKSWVKEVI
jgi:hypothetical protein